MIDHEGKIMRREIASIYGVSHEIIGVIQRNKRWAHVPWPSLQVN